MHSVHMDGIFSLFSLIGQRGPGNQQRAYVSHSHIPRGLIANIVASVVCAFSVSFPFPCNLFTLQARIHVQNS